MSALEASKGPRFHHIGAFGVRVWAVLIEICFLGGRSGVPAKGRQGGLPALFIKEAVRKVLVQGET